MKIFKMIRKSVVYKINIIIMLLVIGIGCTPNSVWTESSSGSVVEEEGDVYSLYEQVEWYAREDMEPVGPVAEWPIMGDTVSVYRLGTSSSNMAVTNDGTLWMWGWNSDYQCATGDLAIQPKPIKVLEDVAVASSGIQHAAAIRTDGTVWAWGNNTSGQIREDLDDIAVLYPVKILDHAAAMGKLGYTTSVVDNQGALWICGLADRGFPGYSVQKIMEDVAYVQEDGYFAALQKDGDLWCWGWNLQGRLGNGTNVEDEMQPVRVLTGVAWVSTGQWNTCAIQKDGDLWMWGAHADGKFAMGEMEQNQTKPLNIMSNVAAAYIGEFHAMALKEDGTLWAWGSNEFGQIGDGKGGGFRNMQWEPVQVMADVRAASANGNSCFATKNDNTLWAWGQNDFGVLGIGSTEHQNAPVMVTDQVHSVYQSESYTLILKLDGTLWACGDNDRGQLGDGTLEDRLTPVLILKDVRLPQSVPWQQGV